jgi:putative peptidoglycan lipid II flippase
VAAGILASRGVGLIREVVIGAALGGGAIADSFRVAMRVPNLLQNLLGEGSVSAAFVPVYARLVEDGRTAEAHRLARQTLGVLSAVVTLLVGLILLAARPLVWVTTFGGLSNERFDLAVELTRFTALGVGFLVLSAFCLGILNAHRRYLLSYSAPVLWSLAQIVGFGAALIAGQSAGDIARWGAVAMVIGSFGQLAVQIPTVRSVGGLGRPSLSIGPDLRTVLGRFVPAVGGRGVVQLSSYVDLALASFLAAGAIATIGYAMPLYLLSIAVFGFSVAVSELTEMSRTRSGLDAVAARVRAAQRRVLLPAGLVTAGAIGGGSIVVGSLYEFVNGLLNSGDSRTAFSSANTTAVALTLAAFGLGLPAAMVARVSQNALYALGDVRGPARIALVRLIVGASAGFILMIQLDHLVVGSADELLDPDGPTSQQVDSVVATDSELDAVVDLALGEPLGGSSLGLTEVGGFPHWPVWEPLPQREPFGSNLVDDPGAVPRGTLFVHLGAVGLGLGSAVASWTEWLLLRRRLQSRLGESIATGIGRWIAVAGLAAFVGARLVAELGLPPVVDLLVVSATVLGVYVGSLRFIGLLGDREPLRRADRPESK